MMSIEQYAELLCHSTVEDWRDQVFKLGSGLGYERVLLAIIPSQKVPTEAEFAFLHSNYSSEWRSKYDSEKLAQVDPTVIHCARKSTPLIWAPAIFAAQKQKEMYEEASGHGLRAGVTLPIHGANGELGILCFVTDVKPDKHFMRDTNLNISELTCLRDFIFESSRQFMASANPADEPAAITRRELECLKWSAAGKSSWEIGQILNCTEATVKFHFGHILRKLNVGSRQQAVVKAVCLGLIFPT